MFTRRSLLLAGAVTFVPLHAASAAAAPDAPQQVQRFSAALIGIMKAGGTAPFAARVAYLAPIVDGVFDLDGILETSVGFYWQGISGAQQADLRQALVASTGVVEIRVA